jgi:hypothetical protein
MFVYTIKDIIGVVILSLLALLIFGGYGFVFISIWIENWKEKRKNK